MRSVPFQILKCVSLGLIISTGILANAQLASEQCKQCRNQCAQTSKTCKETACTVNGGRPGPSSCDAPKDHAKFIEALKVCEKEHSNCFDRCSTSTPNCK